MCWETDAQINYRGSGMNTLMLNQVVAVSVPPDHASHALQIQPTHTCDRSHIVLAVHQCSHGQIRRKWGRGEKQRPRIVDALLRI